jgi:DNA-binding transcriptional ArsR family regulator
MTCESAATIRAPNPEIGPLPSVKRLTLVRAFPPSSLNDESEWESGMGDETLRTVARTLELLQTFGRGQTALSIADLVERLGMPRTVVTRMLATLEKARFVERVPTNRRLFRIGPAAWQVGMLYRPDSEGVAYATSKSPAAPMPPPTHMVTTT